MLIDSLRTLFSGGSVDMMGIVAQILSVIVVILLILPFHEFAHGWVAYKLGDPTAKFQGRLTFNPLASVDYMGALWLLLFGFGWAKPVQVDSRNFKKPRRDMALVSLAGPLANVIAAFAGALVFFAVYAFAPYNSFVSFIISFLSFYISVNMSLAVFNLLPIPPLDGSKILASFLPQRMYESFYRYQNIIVMICFVLLFTGVLSGPLGYLQGLLSKGVLYVASRPFVWLGLIVW